MNVCVLVACLVGWLPFTTPTVDLDVDGGAAWSGLYLFMCTVFFFLSTVYVPSSPADDVRQESLVVVEFLMG